MNLKKKSGFTLLEIIIVIIIVGVLASLALPRFFSTVEYSRSTEALANMAAVRQSLERCYIVSGGNYGDCAVDSLDIDNPATAPGSHFSYVIVGDTAGYSLTAYRDSSIDGGHDTDWIRIEQQSGGITRSGTGNFVGIK